MRRGQSCESARSEVLRDGSRVERRGSDGGGLRMAEGERKTQVRSGDRSLCPWLHLVGARVPKGGGKGGKGSEGIQGGKGDGSEAFPSLATNSARLAT